MKSLCVWVSGIALGAALVFSVPKAKAQVAVGFTYQGVLEENGVPYNGIAAFTISLSDNKGNPLWTETMQNQHVTDGALNLVIGGPAPNNFPSTMTFYGQYSMQITVTTADGTTTLSTALWSSPYAMNAITVNGLFGSQQPASGTLFPVPVGTGYTGTIKLSPEFLPTIPNRSLQTPDDLTINGIGPSAQGDLAITPGSGISVVTSTSSITINLSSVDGTTSSTSPSYTVQNAEINGNSALLLKGGIGANNANGSTDGSGLTSGSPQMYWADGVAVPTVTGTSLQIFNTLVSPNSTIIITPIESAAASSQFAITAQSAGTFTVGSTSSMGAGAVTMLSYLIINH